MTYHQTGEIKVVIYQAWCERCDWTAEVQLGDPDAKTPGEARRLIRARAAYHRINEREPA